MNEVLLIVGMMAVTFAVRYPVLALVGQIELPERAFRALRYVPPAVLTAIIVPGVLMPNGAGLELTPGNEHLLAGIVSVIISWWTKSLALTIILGMAVFLGLRLLMGG